MVAVAHPKTWFSHLIAARDFGGGAGKMYLPSVPEEDAGRFARALAERERLQWYSCPRGHPYTVGECGMVSELMLSCLLQRNQTPFPPSLLFDDARVMPAAALLANGGVPLYSFWV